jgi:cytochrome c nitrite reductase small subunit
MKPRPRRKKPGILLLALLGLGLMLGTSAGIGAYTFLYARGASYMSNDPRACANCHIMNEQFDGWQHSGHRAVTVCNDCHTPHDFVGKWTTKALNGWHHSVAFTTGDFHEPIRIGERNKRITEQACRHCHATVVHQIDNAALSPDPADRLSCLHCHRSVGHMH